MRINWSILAAVSLAPAAFGQIGNIPGTGFTGVPYSAEETITDDAGTRNALLARDAEGRTRQEYVAHREDGSEIRTVRVIDPTAGVTLTWTVDRNAPNQPVAVEPLPIRERHIGPVPEDPDPTPGIKPCGSGCSAEVLPPQQINGYRCRGFRVKRMVPDPATKHESIHTTENWSSPELGVILRHIEVDVLSGRSISEVTNVIRGDPDPSLFQPPPGFAALPISTPGAGR